MSERLIDCAVMIIKLMDRIAKNEVGKHLGNQLMRSDNVSKCDAELQETNELIAIFAKSIGTARGR